MAQGQGGDGVVYELDDWTPDQRQELSTALHGDGVVHVWEGTDLVVAEPDADLVETLIDEIDHPDALAVEDDVDDAGAGVLSSLYVAADVLLAAPDNQAAAGDLVQAAAAASTLPAPYGVDEAVWAEVRRRADELAGHLRDGADEPHLKTAAGSLRRVVWPLV